MVEEKSYVTMSFKNIFNYYNYFFITKLQKLLFIRGDIHFFSLYRS